jgi:hypothetical protein
LYSVIHNAVKAVGEQGRIVIKLGYEQNADSGRRIRIEISDNGCGIATELQNTVFEYGTTYWADEQGTGYGLWRARSILRSMGGEIVLKSSSDDGTIFVIWLRMSVGFGALHHTAQDVDNPRSVYYGDGAVFAHALGGIPSSGSSDINGISLVNEEPLGYYQDNQIYTMPPWLSGVLPVGRYEEGVIYDCPTPDVKTPVGYYRDGDIFKIVSARQSFLVGHYDGPDDGAAAAAKIVGFV